ncbi:MAG: hypothetical protein LBF81_02445 [Prevotellaceae bacterium]|jgi:hypothetical protein|nr:hypothetical protein [Prevotellaceae bacterium]
MKKFGCFMSIVVAVAAFIIFIVMHNRKVSEKEFLEKMERETKERLYKVGKDAILNGYNTIILDAELWSKIAHGYAIKEMDFIDTLLSHRIIAEPVFLDLAFELKSNNEIILNISYCENIVFRLQKDNSYFKFNEIRRDKNVYLVILLKDYKFDDGIEFSGTCYIIDRAFFEPYFKGEFPKWKNYKEYERIKEVERNDTLLVYD